MYLLLNSLTFFSDLNLYPVQFTFQSSNRAYLEGQPINLRDKGFIHILSSVPRSSFWDRGMTHVVSLEGMGAIGIREIGPKPHKPLSAGNSYNNFVLVKILVNLGYPIFLSAYAQLTTNMDVYCKVKQISLTIPNLKLFELEGHFTAVVI